MLQSGMVFDSCTIQLLILSLRRRSTVGTTFEFETSLYHSNPLRYLLYTATSQTSHIGCEHQPSLCWARRFSSLEARGASCFLETRSQQKIWSLARLAGRRRFSTNWSLLIRGNSAVIRVKIWCNYAMYGWVRGAIVLWLEVKTSWGDIIT